ncbi:AAA family ATPase [Clostridium sporogenes]|uniref:AAA family ATPase n=1 Tax=Clostridium sporogenes TaxID=1509 RepID=UPI003F909E97
MIIEAVRIRIETCTGKKFGTDVNFFNHKAKIHNFSLIYGKNTLGKTTLIKSIIYALGGEDLYGNTKKTNLSEIIEEVDGEKSIRSRIFLQINNNINRVVIERNALDKYDSVVVYFNSEINTIDSAKDKKYFKVSKDYKIESDVLFQDFLFNYFNIPFIKEDYSETGIYFQNLMPLFIVTQNSWNDIQSTNPYYGVRGIKQLAFEMILNLSKIKDLEKKIAKNKKNTEIKELNKIINSYNEIIKIFITKDLQENKEKIKDLEVQTQILNKNISKIKSLTNKEIDNYQSYKGKYNNICELSDKYSNEIIILEKQINQYKNYIKKIDNQIRNLDRLKTAKRLIGSIPVKKCPNCFNEIEENLSIDKCSVCGNEFQRIKIAKNNELYKYIIDEKKDFLKLVNIKNKKINLYENKIKLLDLDKTEMEQIIKCIEYSLDGEELKNYFKNVYELGKNQNQIKTLYREQIILEKIKKLKNQISTKENDDIDNINEKCGVNDYDKINYFQSEFRTLLENLDFIKDGMNTNNHNINEIYIDKNSYKPKIKDKNLYNITSSSGFIRILLAYYLALLKTGCHYKNNTNHPLLLILDEPKQQNLDEDTYEKFTEILYELCKENSDIQVIITSGSIGKIQNENTPVNLGEQNYLIQKIE